MDSMLARKIQQLMIFFSLLIPDMTNEEEQMLDEALIKTYNEFGITHDNNSLYADSSVFPPKLKKMPRSFSCCILLQICEPEKNLFNHGSR